MPENSSKLKILTKMKNLASQTTTDVSRAIILSQRFVMGLLIASSYSTSQADSLESLLKTKIQGATRFEQTLEESPSSVTVIGAEEIYKYQYETLSEALNTIKGIYINYDRAYNYTGIRGFSTPGDYNTRMLVNSDGFRLNEPLYDSALVGNELAIDLDWIKSIEYVSGASSSLYGSNALLGIVDLKTLSGNDVNGSKIKTGLGSYGKRKISYLQGGGLDNLGNDWIIGITTYDRTGQSLNINTNTANKLDGESFTKGYAKINFDHLQINFGFSSRNKDIPTGPYGTYTDQPGTKYQDDQLYGAIIYKRNFSDTLESTSKVKLAQYRYIGNFNYPSGIMSDSGESQWLDIDQSFYYNGKKNHKIIVGFGFQSNFKLHQWTNDSLLNDHAKSTRKSIYAQDEWSLNSQLIATYGIRYDEIAYNNISNKFNHTSPRIGFTYLATPFTKIKLIHSEAFRAPNTYELRYNYPGSTAESSSVTNYNLKPEELNNNELIIEHTLNSSTLVSINLFENKFKNFIQSVPTADGDQFQNSGHVKSKGVEFELQWLPSLNNRIKTSITFQESTIDNSTAINAPKTLFKIIGDSSIPGTNLVSSIQLMSSSKTRTAEGELPSHAVSHLSISEKTQKNYGRFSLKINNLLNKKYYLPASSSIHNSQIMQDGRTYFLVWEYQP